MILIAENMNSSVPAFQTMLSGRDEAAVRSLANRLSGSGAHYIDVNAAQLHDRETELLRWLIRIVAESTELPLVIDSPDPASILEGLDELAKVSHHRPLINSITLEPSRFESLKRAALEYDCSLDRKSVV